MKTEFTHRRPSRLLVAGMLAGIIATGSLPSSELAAQTSPASEAAADTPVTLEWVLTESDRAGLGNERIRRLLAFVDSLDPSEIEPTIDRLLEDYADGRFHEATRMLYSRWWELDRDAALQHVLALEGDVQFSPMNLVMTLWAAANPMEAWQWFIENADTVHRSSGMPILREIVRDDPAKALKMYAESSVLHRSLNGSNPGFLYGFWATQDPAAAAAHLDASSLSPSERSSAMLSILTVWIRTDFDAAWKWAKSARQTDGRHRAMETAVSFLALSDLDKAESLLVEFPEGPARQSAISNLASSLQLEDPERAFEIMRKHGGTRIESNILGRWAIFDADAALETAKTQIPIGPRQKQAFNAIISSVARHDTAKAIRILEGFGPGSKLTHGASMIATQMAQHDLDAALKWAESLQDDELKKAALSEVASKWLDTAAEDAATYALAREADGSSQGLLSTTLSRWGYKDPKACAQWIVDHLKESDQRSHLGSAVGHWAEHEPEAASEWTAALPGSETRDDCIGRLGSQWGYHHPAGGDKWLAGLAPGKARDQAISNYATRAFEYFPEKALEWCTKIDDPALQKRAVQQNAYQYLRDQPERAREWIRSSSLPDELKKSLLGK